MPHKANAARRHHIPRPKRRVTNWADYNEALRQRGSLTVWFTDAAIAAWKAVPRTTPGGQPHYSDLAITTALTGSRQELCVAVRHKRTNRQRDVGIPDLPWDPITSSQWESLDRQRRQSAALSRSAVAC